MSKTQMQTHKEAYTFDYPAAIEMAEAQQKVFWANEVEVAKDIQDMRVNMTNAEYHGVVTTLKLFTLYELKAGNEYWGGRFKRMFPRHDIRQMASTFAYTELGIHAPFYNDINKALHLDNDEFYTGYVDDPILKARMDAIDGYISDPDDLVSLAAFSMVEGAVLYSSFAFLKHFQTRGKNKLMTVVRGINYSVRDENLHADGGAWAFKQLLLEKQEASHVIDSDLYYKVINIAVELYEHECQIIDMIFAEGEIEGVDSNDMKKFVASRVNICLGKLGIETHFADTENSIEKWFYKDINAVKLTDFFTGVDSSYNRDWREMGFTWKN